MIDMAIPVNHSFLDYKNHETLIFNMSNGKFNFCIGLFNIIYFAQLAMQLGYIPKDDKWTNTLNEYYKNDDCYNAHKKICMKKPAIITNCICDNCDNPILFKVKDTKHEFQIGLFTILNCLKIAEQNNYIPQINVQFWILVENRYHLSNKF
ncbi:hypothetical protein [Gilliamella sp. BG6]|uniref:hypothetical protein n=1 Tax=Gilliamella sp. BG6 TaxID=3351512 RepID=UPI003987363C